MSEITNLKITGMSCGHCTGSTTKALEAVAGVTHVEVSLEPGGAKVTGTASSESLIAAVVEAGFEAELA
ncbi:MAG: cation transporter [Gammaproteobacteria bacterium]|nr:cation transporter [Gammaproteobacteria bacterium]